MGWLNRVIQREYVFLFKGLYISLPPTLPPLFFFFLKSRHTVHHFLFCSPPHKHTPHLSAGVVSTHIIFVVLWPQVPQELCQRTMHAADYSTQLSVNEPGPRVLAFSNPHILDCIFPQTIIEYQGWAVACHLEEEFPMVAWRISYLTASPSSPHYISAFQKLRGIKSIYIIHIKILEVSEVFLSGRVALDLIPRIPPAQTHYNSL